MTATNPATSRAVVVAAAETGVATAAEATVVEEAVADRSATNVSISLVLEGILADNIHRWPGRSYRSFVPPGWW